MGQAIYEPWIKRVVPLVTPSPMAHGNGAAVDDTNHATFGYGRQTIGFNAPDRIGSRLAEKISQQGEINPGYRCLSNVMQRVAPP